jgi:predicted PurR-regulated permease PerM
LAIAIVFSALLALTVVFITLTIPALITQATHLLEQEPALRDRLRGGLFSVVPRSHHIRLSRVMLNLETIVGGYIRGQVITSAFMAAFVFILLRACGVPSALTISMFAGVADVLPYAGGLLSVGAAATASISRGPVIIILVLALMLAYEEFKSRVIVPRVYGQELRLPSSVILFSLLAGGVLMGIPGALLALPVAAAILMLVGELRVELPGQQEQAEDMEIKERDDRGEEEYERRAEGMPAEQAAAIAVEISADRSKEEKHPSPKPEAPATEGRPD